MKIIKENIPNLEKVIHSDDDKIDVVGQIPITMADAYIDSKNLDKKAEEQEKELVDLSSGFTGADEQPVPEEVELPKATLDESLFEDWDDDYESDFNDREVRSGDTFIEGGIEYKWVGPFGDVAHLDFDSWQIWSADNTEDIDEPAQFFIVDVDNGFIDWGPVDSLKEAQEFLQSKIDDYNMDESIDESQSLRDKSKKLHADILNALDYFIDVELYKFPSDWLANSWEDLRDGVEMGTDDDLDVANNIIEYLENTVKFNRSHPDIADPAADDENKIYNTLKADIKMFANESLDEKLIPPTKQLQDAVEKVFSDNGFEIESKSEDSFWGDNIHYQVINPSASIGTNPDFNDLSAECGSVADALNELGDQFNSPITFNFGPNKDGILTGGIDVRSMSVDDSLDESTIKLNRYDVSFQVMLPETFSKEDVKKEIMNTLGQKNNLYFKDGDIKISSVENISEGRPRKTMAGEDLYDTLLIELSPDDYVNQKAQTKFPDVNVIDRYNYIHDIAVDTNEDGSVGYIRVYNDDLDFAEKVAKAYDVKHKITPEYLEMAVPIAESVNKEANKKLNEAAIPTSYKEYWVYKDLKDMYNIIVKPNFVEIRWKDDNELYAHFDIEDAKEILGDDFDSRYDDEYIVKLYGEIINDDADGPLSTFDEAVESCLYYFYTRF